jgi:cleavage stimulation factor subunit 3
MLPGASLGLLRARALKLSVARKQLQTSITKNLTTHPLTHLLSSHTIPTSSLPAYPPSLNPRALSIPKIIMAEEYDPLDPPTFNAEDDNDDSYDPAAVVSGNAADDDDEEEYEPGYENATPPHETPAHSTTASAQPSQQVSRTPSAAPNVAEQSTQPKTVGGFILEESDDEEDATPAPSQLNGTRGAQSGLGAVATSEAQDLTLGSEPTPDAVAASFAQQNNGLMGSTTVATSTTASLSAPVSSVTSDIPVPAVQVSAASAERGNVLSPSVQPSAAPTPAPKPADGASTSQTAQSAPLAHRLPHDKVGQLEDRITDDPKADTDAWMTLIAHYKEKDQPDNARKVYERFLAVFPSAVCTSPQHHTRT